MDQSAHSRSHPHDIQGFTAGLRFKWQDNWWRVTLRYAHMRLGKKRKEGSKITALFSKSQGADWQGGLCKVQRGEISSLDNSQDMNGTRALGEHMALISDPSVTVRISNNSPQMVQNKEIGWRESKRTEKSKYKQEDDWVETDRQLEK